MARFRIGQLVEVVNNESPFKTVGLQGIVIADEDNEIYPDCVAVRHCQDFYDGHDCEGLCDSPYGLWYSDPKHQLNVIAQNEIQVSDSVCGLFL